MPKLRDREVFSENVTLRTDTGRVTFELRFSALHSYDGSRLTVDLEPVAADALEMHALYDAIDYSGGHAIGSGESVSRYVMDMARSIPAVVKWLAIVEKNSGNGLNAGTREQKDALQYATLSRLDYYRDACAFLEAIDLLTVERNGTVYKYGHGWLYLPIDVDAIKAAWAELCAAVGEANAARAAAIEAAEARKLSEDDDDASEDDDEDDEEEDERDAFERIAEESGIDEDQLRALGEHLSVDADDAAAYHSENYQGQHDDGEAFAENFLDEIGDLSSVPEHLRNYIDFDKYWEQSLRYDYFELDNTGHFYRNA